MSQILILGSGRSGLAATKLICSLGKQAKVIDELPISISARKEIERHGATFFQNFKNLDTLDLSNIESVIVSPGIPGNHPIVRKALKQSITVLSETEFALSLFKGKSIGVTGTNGKSTTASMIYHLLQKLGIDAELAGNIGTPVSSVVSRKPSIQPKYLVIELSSYQLEQSTNLPLEAAIFLNLSEDHLQRHGTMENYLKQKWKIFSNVSANGVALASSDVYKTADSLSLLPVDCRVIPFDPTVALKEMSQEQDLQGTWHNKLNAYCASDLVSRLFQYSKHELIQQLKSFQELSHRFEVFGEINGKRVINDSKATNLNSTLTALSNQTMPTVLMIGGHGKGEDFSCIDQYNHILESVICFGQEALSIRSSISDLNPLVFPSLKDAVVAIPEILGNLNTPSELLFSPGCSSFDEFKDFEERGNFFKQSLSGLVCRSKNKK